VDCGDYAFFGIDAISDRRKKLSYRIKAITFEALERCRRQAAQGIKKARQWEQVGAPAGRTGNCIMKDFPNASFPPETLGIMKNAMDAAVAELPDPVSSAHIHSIAETILRTAKDGETDPAILQRMALLELQITPRG
jgi:hypothetical protein